MADYISQFTGSEIDQRLAKVPQLESGKQDKLVSGSNIKTINGQSVLGSGDMQIQAGDTDAVKYVAQTLTDAQKAQARTNIAAASAAELGQIVTDLTGIEADIDSLEAAVAAINVGDYVTATTLPAASASTMGHIYLIGPDANNNYDRYFTQESGGSYSWVSLGSTQIDLSTYATQAEVDQLEAKVDSLPRGKNYGFFTSSSLLPSGATEEGFAYVGATEPYAIWQFDGTSWTDSGVTANAFTANPEDVQDAVDEYLQDHPTATGTFLNSAKRSLLRLLEKVAFIDEHGADYISDLRSQLFLAPIDHIDAVYTQGGEKVYDIFDLDSLKENLVVTVYYTDGASEPTSDYSLSGTLQAGTSVITVSVFDSIEQTTITDTFNVLVTGTLKLYVNGDECTANSGGWQTKGFNVGAGSPVVTKEATDLLIRFDATSSQAVARCWSTVNPINLSAYNKILVEYEGDNGTGSHGAGYGWSYFPSTLVEGETPTDAYGSDYSTNRKGICKFQEDTGLLTRPVAGNVYFDSYALTATHQSGYVSLCINLYRSSNNTDFIAGAFWKIRKVALVNE